MAEPWQCSCAARSHGECACGAWDIPIPVAKLFRGSMIAGAALLINASAIVDRSGEAGETAKQGSTEGESDGALKAQSPKL